MIAYDIFSVDESIHRASFMPNAEYEIIVYHPGEEEKIQEGQEDIAGLFDLYNREYLHLPTSQSHFRWDNKKNFQALALAREPGSGKFVGFTVLQDFGQEMELTASYVPEYKRGHHIFSSLADVLIEEARIAGASQLVGFIPSADNERLITCLEKKGFKKENGSAMKLIYKFEG